MSAEVPGASPVDQPDLTKFQELILSVLAEESRYGLAIKRELQEYYAEDVNHGRLYPNLNDLKELGLLEVEALDKRTNLYKITESGRRAMVSDLSWRLNRVGVSLEEVED